jgi:hypothetical protein
VGVDFVIAWLQCERFLGYVTSCRCKQRGEMTKSGGKRLKSAATPRSFDYAQDDNHKGCALRQ